MFDYAACIVVANEVGAHLQLHEYRGKLLFRGLRRFVLETGEPVKRIDFDHYEVPATGQRLVRVA